MITDEADQVGSPVTIEVSWPAEPGMILPATTDQLAAGASELAVTVVEPQIACPCDHSQVGMAIPIGVTNACDGTDVATEAHAHGVSQLAGARAAPKIDLLAQCAHQNVLIAVAVPIAGIDYMGVRADLCGDRDRLLQLAFGGGIPLECACGANQQQVHRRTGLIAAWEGRVRLAGPVGSGSRCHLGWR